MKSAISQSFSVNCERPHYVAELHRRYIKP